LDTPKHPQNPGKKTNTQVHSLNQKLERLASQHAALVAVNAQQQEAWEGAAGADMRELKDAISGLSAALAPTQRQVLQIALQVRAASLKRRRRGSEATAARRRRQWGAAAGGGGGGGPGARPR
jgi:chromosome segregation ATPase